MSCNWKITESVVAIVVLIFTWWQSTFSQWIVTLAALALLLHVIIPHSHSDMYSEMKTSKKKRL